MCRRWEELILKDASLVSILSATSMKSRLQLFNQLVKSISVPVCAVFFPTNGVMKQCWDDYSVIKCLERSPAAPKDFSVLSRCRSLWSFLYRLLVLWDQSSFLLSWTPRYLKKSTIAKSETKIFTVVLGKSISTSFALLVLKRRWFSHYSTKSGRTTLHFCLFSSGTHPTMVPHNCCNWGPMCTVRPGMVRTRSVV